MKKQNLSNMLNKYINNVLFNIHTVQPGKIISYEPAQKKAKIQPLINMKDNNNNIYKIDPIDNVPVVFPITSNFELKYELQKDDGVLLLFSELQMGNYLNSGSGLPIVDADDSNKFELTNCIAIPGLYSFGSVPTPKNMIEIDLNNNLTIKTELGTISIDQQGTIKSENNAASIEINNTGKITLTNSSGANIELDTASLLGINNNIASLKDKIDELWSAIDDIYTTNVSWTSTPAAVGSPVTPNPATTALFAAGKVQAALNKAAVSNLLK